MSKELQGKVALVTGASKGVGKGIALQLARRDCSVVVNYNSDRAVAEATVAEIIGMGVAASAVRADVGKASDVDAMFAKVLKDCGHLDFLVNNAGVQTWKSMLEITEAEWDRVL